MCEHVDLHACDVEGRTPLARAFRFQRIDVAKALLDHGAKLSRVTTSVPGWVRPFVEARERCRYAAVLLLGIRIFGHSAVLRSNNRNAIEELARAVWQTRLDPAWERATEPPQKQRQLTSDRGTRRISCRRVLKK